MDWEKNVIQLTSADIICLVNLYQEKKLHLR